MPRAKKTHLKVVANDFITFERPSDKDTEVAVISSFTFGGVEVFNQYLGIVQESYFTTPAYRTAYRALLQMKDEGVWADVDQLGSIFLAYMRKQISANIEEEIMQIIQEVKPGVRYSNLDSHIDQLTEKYRLRKLQDCMFHIWGDMNTDTCRSEEAIKQMKSTVKTLELVGGLRTGKRAGENYEDRMAVMESQAASGQRYTGIATAVHKVNEMTLGYQKGDLIIHAGRPGMGKTRITLNDIWQASQMYPAKLFGVNSLEMTREAIEDQLIAIISGLNLAKLRCPTELSKRDWQMIDEARKRLQKIGNIIIEDKKMTVEAIYGQWLRLAAYDDIGFFGVDYLQYLARLDLAKFGFDMRLAVMITAGTLKDFAKAEGYPVIAVSTVNRQCESRDDKHPQEGDIGESDTVGYDADVVKMVYRNHVYDKCSSVNHMEIGIVKQRQGPTGWVDAFYEPKSGRITDPEGHKKRLPQEQLDEQFLDGL